MSHTKMFFKSNQLATHLYVFIFSSLPCILRLVSHNTTLHCTSYRTLHCNSTTLKFTAPYYTTPKGFNVLLRTTDNRSFKQTNFYFFFVRSCPSYLKSSYYEKKYAVPAQVLAFLSSLQASREARARKEQKERKMAEVFYSEKIRMVS